MFQLYYIMILLETRMITLESPHSPSKNYADICSDCECFWILSPSYFQYATLHSIIKIQLQISWWSVVGTQHFHLMASIPARGLRFCKSYSVTKLNKIQLIQANNKMYEPNNSMISKSFKTKEDFRWGWTFP